MINIYDVLIIYSNKWVCFGFYGLIQTLLLSLLCIEPNFFCSIEFGIVIISRREKWEPSFCRKNLENRQKSVKMTGIGENRIQSLIKVGYFLSLLISWEPNSNLESLLYLC